MVWSGHECGPGVATGSDPVVRGDCSGAPRGRAQAPTTWAGANWASSGGVGRHGRVRAYPQHDVWVVETDGPLDQVADDIDHGIQSVLAEYPRAVVCGVAGRLDQVGWSALDTLASIGRHPKAWPETPVVMAFEDRSAAELIGHRREGRHLRFAASMLSAWTEAALHRPLLGARMLLGPSPTAARAARRFLAQACEEWGVPSCTPVGELVVSELATNALRHAGTDLEVMLASDGKSMLRVGVRDRLGAAPASRPCSEGGLGGRGLHIVRTVASGCGALPTADGGKVVWATIRPGGTLS